MTDDEYKFSSVDHEMLVEIHDLTIELRRIAKPESLYHRVQFWAMLAAAMTMNLGIVLLIGGSQRLSATAYSIILSYGGSLGWGMAFLGTGLATAVCSVWLPKFLRWTILLQAIPYGAIALSFAIAAAHYPDANLTAAPIYAWIMIIHGFLADYARKEY